MSEEAKEEPTAAVPEASTQQELKAQELGQMLGKIKQAKSIANLDLSGWDPSSRTGMEVAKNNARDTLEKLVERYRMEVYQNSAALFVSASPTADPEKLNVQFAALEDAATNMGAIVVDGSRLYRNLAQNIESKLGGDRRLLTDFVLDIERQIADTCSFFGVNGSFLRVNQRFYDAPVPTFDALVEVIRDTFRNGQPDWIQSLGDTISILSARQEFYATCETSGIAEVPTAVMVTRLTSAEVAGYQTHFLPGRPFASFEADKVKSADKALEKAANDLLKKLGLNQ